MRAGCGCVRAAEEGAAWTDAYAAAARHGARAHRAPATQICFAFRDEGHCPRGARCKRRHVAAPTPADADPVRYILSLGPTCFSARYLGFVLQRRAFATPFDWIFSSPAIVAHCLGCGRLPSCAALLDPAQHEERGNSSRQCAVGHALYSPMLGRRESVVFNHHDPRSAEGAAYFRRAARRLELALLPPPPPPPPPSPPPPPGDGPLRTGPPPRKLLLMLSMSNAGAPLDDGGLDALFDALCRAGARNFELLAVRCVLRGHSGSSGGAAAAAAADAARACGGRRAVEGQGEQMLLLPAMRLVRKREHAADNDPCRRELAVYELRCRGGAGNLNIALADEADTAAITQLLVHGDETRLLHLPRQLLPDPLLADAAAGGGGPQCVAAAERGYGDDKYLVTPRAVK